MDRKHFTSLLSKRLYPLLRAEGFRGTGATLRRVSEPVVEVFNVQGSSGGDRCYLNLGVHLTFLPAAGGRIVLPGELKESHCAFRTRIDPLLANCLAGHTARTRARPNPPFARSCRNGNVKRSLSFFATRIPAALPNWSRNSRSRMFIQCICSRSLASRCNLAARSEPCCWALRPGAGGPAHTRAKARDHTIPCDSRQVRQKVKERHLAHARSRRAVPATISHWPFFLALY